MGRRDLMAGLPIFCLLFLAFVFPGTATSQGVDTLFLDSIRLDFDPMSESALSDLIETFSATSESESEAVNGRIAGGSPVNPVNEYPATVFLVDTQYKYCTGVLLGYRFALTTASCIHDLTTQVAVVAGENDLTHWNTSVKIQIKAIQFAFLPTPTLPGTGNLDIAVVQIFDVFFPTAYVKFSVMASREPAVGLPVLITGWGASSNDTAQLNPSLQKLSLTVVADTEISNRGFDLIAARATSPRGVCGGNSGAPIYHGTGKNIVGIAAFGTSNNCQDGSPHVFTSVVYYAPWIRCKMGTGDCSTPIITTTTPFTTTTSTTTTISITTTPRPSPSTESTTTATQSTTTTTQATATTTSSSTTTPSPTGSTGSWTSATGSSIATSNPGSSSTTAPSSANSFGMSLLGVTLALVIVTAYF